MNYKRNKRKLIQGVGINDADYQVIESKVIDGKQVILWACPIYSAWSLMIQRCYSKRIHKKHPSYADCTVVDEWKYFSNFRSWAVMQDWKGNQIDKDIIVDGNKLYSPETCAFVSPMTNYFVLDSSKSRRKRKIGVCFESGRSGFRVGCRNPFTKKREIWGGFLARMRRI